MVLLESSLSDVAELVTVVDIVFVDASFFGGGLCFPLLELADPPRLFATVFAFVVTLGCFVVDFVGDDCEEVRTVDIDIDVDVGDGQLSVSPQSGLTGRRVLHMPQRRSCLAFSKVHVPHFHHCMGCCCFDSREISPFDPTVEGSSAGG